MARPEERVAREDEIEERAVAEEEERAEESRGEDATVESGRVERVDVLHNTILSHYAIHKSIHACVLLIGKQKRSVSNRYDAVVLRRRVVRNSNMR